MLEDRNIQTRHTRSFRTSWLGKEPPTKSSSHLELADGETRDEAINDDCRSHKSAASIESARIISSFKSADCRRSERSRLSATSSLNLHELTPLRARESKSALSSAGPHMSPNINYATAHAVNFVSCDLQAIKLNGCELAGDLVQIFQPTPT